MTELTKDLLAKSLEAIEVARKTGKIKKGTNEVTKVVEKGLAKMAFVAGDVNPPEITLHLGPLCKEKNIPLVVIPSKEELGAAAGLSVPTVAVAIVVEGDSQDLIKEVSSKL